MEENIITCESIIFYIKNLINKISYQLFLYNQIYGRIGWGHSCICSDNRHQNWEIRMFQNSLICNTRKDILSKDFFFKCSSTREYLRNVKYDKNIIIYFHKSTFDCSRKIPNSKLSPENYKLTSEFWKKALKYHWSILNIKRAIIPSTYWKR